MREAFELSYACALLHCKSEKLYLFAMDEFAFKHPVPIGSVLEYTSFVTYTERYEEDGLLVHVELNADVIDPRKGSRKTTNTFHYTYLIRKASEDGPIDTFKDITVVPYSYQDAMKFIEARRRVSESIKRRKETIAKNIYSL